MVKAITETDIILSILIEGNGSLDEGMCNNNHYVTIHNYLEKFKVVYFTTQ